MRRRDVYKERKGIFFFFEVTELPVFLFWWWLSKLIGLYTKKVNFIACKLNSFLKRKMDSPCT